MSGSRLTYVIRYLSGDDFVQDEEALLLASSADAVQIAKIRLRATSAFDQAVVSLDGRPLYTVRRVEALVQSFPPGPDEAAGISVVAWDRRAPEEPPLSTENPGIVRRGQPGLTIAHIARASGYRGQRVGVWALTARTFVKYAGRDHRRGEAHDASSIGPAFWTIEQAAWVVDLPV